MVKKKKKDSIKITTVKKNYKKRRKIQEKLEWSRKKEDSRKTTTVKKKRKIQEKLGQSGEKEGLRKTRTVKKKRRFKKI